MMRVWLGDIGNKEEKGGKFYFVTISNAEIERRVKRENDYSMISNLKIETKGVKGDAQYRNG